MVYSSEKLAQLGHPAGEDGKKILVHLNKVNLAINRLTSRVLSPNAHDKLLEIGFGGGALIAEITRSTPGIQTVGADISRLAVSEAERRYHELVATGAVRFVHLSDEKLPFEDGAFTKVCCVNVIYFWADIHRALKEACRVIEPGGMFVISYAYRSPDRITKFPNGKVEGWLAQAGFVEPNSLSGIDRENGQYFCTSARKSP